jgi:endogenous inhibitor of DNA gyrase (YacG/DUF329 family)
MSEVSKPARIIRCPGCGGPSVYSPENASRPFCSPRCKNNDFGAWASEGYAVAADPDPDAPDADEERPLPH